LKGKSLLCDFKARQRNDRTLIFNHKEIKNLKNYFDGCELHDYLASRRKVYRAQIISEFVAN